MNDNQFWVRVWAIVMGGIVCISIVIAIGTALNKSIAFKHGYEQVSLPGVEGSRWQKVK